MPPPGYWPVRRKTKAELEFERKQAMASTIMSALAKFQPKKRKRRKGV